MAGGAISDMSHQPEHGNGLERYFSTQTVPHLMNCLHNLLKTLGVREKIVKVGEIEAH